MDKFNRNLPKYAVMDDNDGIEIHNRLNELTDATEEMYKDLFEVHENQLKIMVALNNLRHASIKASRASLISLAVASASFIVMALHLLGYF